MPQSHSETNHARGRKLLAIAVTGVLVLWLAVLPQIGSRPHIRQYIERNERLGIDPSVKFYSELPAMPSILTRIDDIWRRDAATSGDRTYNKQ